MKIGLEATRANKQYKTGTEWYAWHLIQGFKKLDHNINFVLYYNKYLAGDLKDAPDNFYLKSLPWPFKKFWTHFRLAWELTTRPVDKFFATNALPLFGKGEMIVTIHDLGFLKNPELYHPLERWYQKFSHYLAIKKADKIITISETSKKDIIKFFPQAKDKVKVIYLGYNQDSFNPITKEAKKEFLDKHDYPDKYLLYIGRLESKKNITKLLEAYKKSTRRWPLILAGRPGNYGFDKIEKLAKDPKLRDDVLLLGYVSQNNYPSLMASASGFVFPSKFEGFGLPVLEAMASGVPVLCSDIEVLHEVASDSALYFNPDDTEDIKNKLERLFDDQDKRQELIENGLKRAEEFSWDKTTKETLKYILE